MKIDLKNKFDANEEWEGDVDESWNTTNIIMERANFRKKRLLLFSEIV